MSEVRQIPFTEHYFVSDAGEVFSTKWGTMRQLKPWLHKFGYPMVTIGTTPRTHKIPVHRLVALVFIGSPASPDLEVRHLDGEPTNNMASNLAWGTHAENMADMVAHGRQGSIVKIERMPRGDRHGSKTKPGSVVRGEQHYLTALSEKDVAEMRRLYSGGIRTADIARRFGVSYQTVWFIKENRTWKHIGMETV
jgi:hypothetical protein